jgi:microsomal dipeptidase-like Zn-dependent dipeptidase
VKKCSLFSHFDPCHKQQNITPPTNSTPKGIEDVSAYPYLFAELMGHGWTAEELTKLAGGNLLRVFSEVIFFQLHSVFGEVYCLVVSDCIW